LLTDDEGFVEVVLSGGVDEQRIHYCVGTLRARLEVTCQRCLQAMQLNLEVEMRLGLIRADNQAKALPKVYEPLVSADGVMALSELVEDELLLALPVAPLHGEIRQCEAAGFVLPEAHEHGGGLSADDEPSPFSVLSELLKKST
jgi:uncharacterized protein